MIALTRGRKQTTNERREATKDKLIGQLEHKIWQHECRIDKQAYRELKIILERLQDVRTEEVQSACIKYSCNFI